MVHDRSSTPREVIVYALTRLSFLLASALSFFEQQLFVPEVTRWNP